MPVGECEAELMDKDEEDPTGEAKDFTMMQIAATTATGCGSETESGALGSIDYGDPAHLH
jgi:hypothetical protein